MTAPAAVADATRAFVAALPAHVRDQLHVTQLVQGMVHAAIRDHGWTVTQLAHECGRDLAGTANAAAVVTFRLRHAAGHPPPDSHKPAGRPFCTPECRSNAGWICHPETGLPVDRCPCRTPQETNH